MKIAIIPASFDPATLGHADIIRRAAEIFDRVYPVVVANAEKNGMFSGEERLRILSLACKDIENADCRLYSGLTSDFASSVGARYIVRGARNASDFDFEFGYAQIMKKFDPCLETVIIPASPDLAYLSSSYARECIKYGCDMSNFASPETAELISEIMRKKGGI